MSKFDRTVTSIVIFTVTAIGIIIDAFTRVDVSLRAWVIWLSCSALWVTYLGYAAYRDGKRHAADVDRAISEMLKRVKPRQETHKINGAILTGVHPEESCIGQPCCIHNPSDHKMCTWPQNWRGDMGIMERLCSHGIGHPDPDDLSYHPVHGCDGCCFEGDAA